MLPKNLLYNHSRSFKLLVALWLYLCCACYGYAQCPDSPGDPYYAFFFTSNVVAGKNNACNPDCPVKEYPSSFTYEFGSMSLNQATSQLDINYSHHSKGGGRPVCFDPYAPPFDTVINHNTSWGEEDYRDDFRLINNSAQHFGAPVYVYFTEEDGYGNIYRSESLDAIKAAIDSLGTSLNNNNSVPDPYDPDGNTCISGGEMYIFLTIGTVWRHSELAANPSNFNSTPPDCLCQPTTAGKCARNVACPDDTSNCLEFYDCQTSVCTGSYNPNGEQPEEPEEPCATAPAITIQQPPKPE